MEAQLPPGQFRRTWYSPEVMAFCAARELDPDEFMASAGHTVALRNADLLVIRTDKPLDAPTGLTDGRRRDERLD